MLQSGSQGLASKEAYHQLQIHLELFQTMLYNLGCSFLLNAVNPKQNTPWYTEPHEIFPCLWLV